MSLAASVKPPMLQGDVIALFAQGVSKRKIARQLSLDRATVDRILKSYSQDKPDAANRMSKIKPLAYDALEKALSAGDGRLGLDLLKATDLAPSQASTYNINADQVLMTGLDMMPKRDTPQVPDSARVIDVQASAAPTEAPAKPPVSDINLSLPTNFSPNLESTSTEDLVAELHRRGAI